ncbi:uncharacterized protein [Ptychodera flava]|uniref:uncharacterized protein n=1 Tax=Ptychodera flava TaxID=63121 RepID=UPI00396A10AA
METDEENLNVTLDRDVLKDLVMDNTAANMTPRLSSRLRAQTSTSIECTFDGKNEDATHTRQPKLSYQNSASSFHSNRRRVASRQFVNKLRREKAPTPPELQSNKCTLHVKRNQPRDLIYFNAGRRSDGKTLTTQRPDSRIFPPLGDDYGLSRSKTNWEFELNRKYTQNDDEQPMDVDENNATNVEYYKFSDFCRWQYNQRCDTNLSTTPPYYRGNNIGVDKMSYVLNWLYNSVNT